MHGSVQCLNKRRQEYCINAPCTIRLCRILLTLVADKCIGKSKTVQVKRFILDECIGESLSVVVSNVLLHRSTK